MKTRQDIIREEAVRIMRFVQDEMRLQIKRGEDPQYADATNECMDGVCDMIGACANEITANTRIADTGGAAFGGTLDSLVGRRTVKSRCPVCDGVIDSVPIKYGVKAMMACPHCATVVVLDVEDARIADTGGANAIKANDRQEESEE